MHIPHIPESLTVGQVAGIINAAVIVAHFSFPLIVVFVVVGILSESYNAATWSVLGRLLNNSKWPYILRSDSVTKRKVSKRVLIPSAISSFGLLFLGIVSSVTPLGLSSSISQVAPQLVAFQYIQDDSPIGQATTSHADYATNRLCGYFIQLNCPGNAAGYTTFENSTGWYGIANTPDAYISSTIASNITEAFTSATSDPGNTISSVFDIQYRSFVQYNNSTRPGPDESAPWIDQGRPRSQGGSQFYQSLILNNRFEAVEGVVLDLVSGGIGFRNHTLPPSSSTGFVWQEDLLWIEPETVCVDLNITVDYSIDPDGGALNGRLTDRGGLVHLTKDYPQLDMNNTQNDPALYGRAWKGAVLTNYNIMIYFNETRNRTAVGKTYSLKGTGTIAGLLTPNQISLTPFGDGSLGPTLPSPLELTDSSTDFSSLNGTAKYLGIDVVTQGFGQIDLARINTITAATGLMLGAATQVDASGNPIQASTGIRLQPLSNWTQPLYSCASTLKASVKRVSFQINGTALVSNLVVTDIQPVTYPNNDTRPVWAVENTGLSIANVAPFWGLISSKYVSSKSLYTIQREHLYLPAGSGSLFGVDHGDGAAGAEAPAGALSQLYDSALTDAVGLPDYTGETNYPMFLKWKDLSRNKSTASTILNLIWTDMMANYVVGSKSHLSRNGTAPVSSAMVTATPFANTIKYNYLYAIPAFIFLVLYIVMLIISIIFFLFRRVRFNTLRMLLNQTSAGRAVTTERHGERISARTPTNQWIEVLGDEKIKVKKGMANEKYVNTPLEEYSSPYTRSEAWDMQKYPTSSQVRLHPE
ncbi:hypothetical protein F5884DRAFT_318929 [Xylogone sp. PMI_703]|nr:hypothetical protein F5884DRAFT_318929 [Xylogone sp. PMI_703]